MVTKAIKITARSAASIMPYYKFNTVCIQDWLSDRSICVLNKIPNISRTETAPGVCEKWVENQELYVQNSDGEFSAFRQHNISNYFAIGNEKVRRYLRFKKLGIRN